MGKFSLLIILVFLSIIFLFSLSNNELATIHVPFYHTYEIPKIGIMLVSSLFGALTMLIVYAVRDTRRFIENYQTQKRHKKEAKIHELYSKSLNAILANDDEEARGAIEGILKEDPGHTDALLRLGDIASREGNYNSAAAYFKKALSLSPRNFEALFSLERSMEAGGRWPEAMNYVEEILDIDPDNLSALYKKRAILEKTGRWDDVIDVQKSVLKHEHAEKERAREQANLLGFRYEYARWCLENGDKDKANKEFRIILRIEKNFIPAYLGSAEVMLDAGDSEEAVEFLEKAYEQTYSPIILARVEDLLINLGDPYRIIRIYKNAISGRPQDNTLKFFLGKLYYRLEMVDDAFETLRAMDPQEPYPELYMLLGELYLRRNRCERAVEEFKKAVGMKKTFRLPYCCSSCGYFSGEWSGRCPNCDKWNSYQFNLHGTCKV